MSTEKEHYGKMAEPETLKFEMPKDINPESLRIKREKTITFEINKLNKTPILMLCDNGDIFVKGKLIENDKEVVNAMREFLIRTKKPTE